MTLERLSGCRILIVEDEYFIASDLKRAIHEAGGEMVGPVGCLDDALRRVVSDRIDAAVLDINLDGADTYPVVEALLTQLVPFLFLTGYDAWAMPERYRAYPRLAKPAPVDSVIKALSELTD